MLAKFLECTSFVKNVLLESGAFFSQKLPFTKISIFREQGDVLRHNYAETFQGFSEYTEVASADVAPTH